MEKNFLNSELENISKALYDPKALAVHIGEERCIISVAGNGCRQLVCKNIRFMVQNIHKGSRFAKVANKGHTIVWGMTNPNWIYIRDHKRRSDSWADARRILGTEIQKLVQPV